MRVSLLLFLFFSSTLGDDGKMPPLKVMFFGDSVVAGMHNSETDICPFRYEFLRGLKLLNKEVEVVGTNADPEGTCQTKGEGLDPHNNGYQVSGMSDLLDFITSDLQYLNNPVDYIITSMGMQECLNWESGKDFQILSQSTRRIMGRLLNLNDNAMIIHVPILLPESAGETATKCMNFVTTKLREVYDQKNKARIKIMSKVDENLKDDMFNVVGKKPASKSKTSSDAEDQKSSDSNGEKVTKKKKAEETKTESKETRENQAEPKKEDKRAEPKNTEKKQKPAKEKKEELPREEKKIKKVAEKSTEKETAEVIKEVTARARRREGKQNGRRASEPFVYLPKTELTITIANILLKMIKFEFRANTPTPTMDVTKDPDYYGYDWCMKNFQEEECFEYYYGYVWCLKKYSEDECYNYYYGESEWESQDSYKWCLNFYDEEYCSFAYKGEEPDTWDWLSFGYQDCLRKKNSEECFNEYYGYAWCLKEYSNENCYEYYYGADYWEWDSKASYKWCLNFYTTEECSEKYEDGAPVLANADKSPENKVPSLFFGFSPLVAGGAFAIFACLMVCCCSKRCKNRPENQYSRLNTRFAEDEIGLL